MPIVYEVWVHTPDYSQRTAILAEFGEGYIFASLKIERIENQVTEAVLTMAYQAGIVALFPLDTRLEFYDDGRLEGQTQWFVRVPPKLTYESGMLIVEVRAKCALYLLSGRIVAYAAGSSQAVKSGPADNVIKAIVRENLHSLAAADRDLSVYLDVQANTSLGATVYKTIPRRNVLLVCQEIARASAQAGAAIFFDVVWTGSRLEFRTYLEYRGDDHRADSLAPIVLSPEFGTLSNASRSFDHGDEATVVYCAGQGRGSDRLIVSVSDDARRTQTPFNRREVFVDARYLALSSSVATEADGTLWRRRPTQSIGGTFEDTDTRRYGVDWGWGDLTAGEFNGDVLDLRVHRVVIAVANGGRAISGELRADSTEADDAVRRIEGQLDASSADELPVFTLTPTADAVPVADGSGRIADGWLSSLIARLADVTAEAIARAATDTAHAALTTGAHGGIVASTDARLSDAREPLPHSASLITTGQLSPARGGTGVDNGSNTLTIPVSGTAALRASAATAGRVAFWSDDKSLSHDADCFWDDTNNRLGIGTASPSAKLDVINGYMRARDGSNTPPTSGEGVEMVSIGGVGYLMSYNRGSGLFRALYVEGLPLLLNVQSGGNVGIRVSPSATLDIARGTASSGTLVVRGTTNACHFNYSTVEDTYIRGGKATSRVLINDASSGDTLIANGGGNTGVGSVTVPTGIFHVRNAGGANFLIWSNEAVGGTEITIVPGGSGYSNNYMTQINWMVRGNTSGGVNQNAADFHFVPGSGSVNSTLVVDSSTFMLRSYSTGAITVNSPSDGGLSIRM